MNLKTRKNIRLKDYDYSTPGAYFITVCTKNRNKCFWKNVGMRIAHPQDIVLSEIGEIVVTAINNIEIIYPLVSVDKYVIMPDHIHLILQIHENHSGRAMRVPTIDNVILHFKEYVTKKSGVKIWQPRYYDHIIRNQSDYNEIWEYIENNPLKYVVMHNIVP